MISEPQKRLLRAVRDYWLENGYAPSIRELQELGGWSTTSMPAYHAMRLKSEGYVTYTPEKARTMRLTAEGEAAIA